MFLHNFIYELKTAVRTKDLIIWMVLFPIALGAFFKFAFDGIYEKATKFSAVDTAVVEEDGGAFRSIIGEMERSGEPLLNATYTDRDEAMKLLKDGDVYGIIFAGEELKLSVSGNGTEQAVLKSFVEEYNLRSRIIKRTAETDPAAVQRVSAVISENVEAVKQIPLTEGNTDNLIQYFYNLLGMVAMFGILTGLNITKVNQANLSALGARKSCSPTPKSLSVTASLMASYLIQIICMLMSVTYIAFVLRVDFGDRLHIVYLTSVLAGMVGVSLGFFIGSIGTFSERTKVGFSLAFSLLLCFFSGLMVGNMKTQVERFAPIVNKINPAAIISDSYYCLNVYRDYDRYTEKVITMVIMTAVFALLGFFMTRRRKYASI